MVVTDLEPLVFYLFLNCKLIQQDEVESFSLAIESPNEEQQSEGIVRATLSRYVTNVAGERAQRYQDLFPSTIEIVAEGRRISVTCPNSGSLDGLWISLGLKSDGSSAEVTGAQSLRIVISDGILDAKLTWTDGITEDLLEKPAIAAESD